MSAPSLVGVMVAIGAVTGRALLGRRRAILMLIVAFTPVLLGILLQVGSGPRPQALVGALEGLVLTSVLPLVALVFGTAALGGELDDGTAVHLLTKPIPRWAIIVPKVAIAGGLTAAMVGPATLVAGILIGGPTAASLAITLAFVLAVIIGSFVYGAIFVALSAATSRGLIIGLGYSLLWEGLLAGALPGTQLLSVREYLRGIVSAAAPAGTLDSVTGSMGLVLSLAAIAIVTIVATRRLDGYEVRAAE